MDGEITPDRLAAELDGDGEPVVVDIRDPGPFQRGHIPDSLNLPLADLVHSVDRLADADHVVTVCPHGQASVRAARLIAASAAFDGTVESLRGGLTAWDGPIERESAAAGSTDEAPDAPF
jgi:rhodanese-related sulfurtransferase